MNTIISDYTDYLQKASYGGLVDIKYNQLASSSRSRLGNVLIEIKRRFPEMNSSSDNTIDSSDSDKTDRRVSLIIESGTFGVLKEIVQYSLFGFVLFFLLYLYLIFFQDIQIPFIFVPFFSSVVSIPVIVTNTTWYLKHTDFCLFFNRDEKMFLVKYLNGSTTFYPNDIEYINRTRFPDRMFRNRFKRNLWIRYHLKLVDGSEISIPNTIKESDAFEAILKDQDELTRRVIGDLEGFS